MATLRELERAFHGALRQEQDVDAVAGELGFDPRRLAIYRDFVEGHIKSVLAKDYPVVKGLLPEAVWTELVRGYYAERPSGTWELNACVAGFPQWLAEREDAGQEGLEPFHVSMASWEWEEFQAYVHPAELPDPRTLSGPVLNPTLSVLQLPCPVVRYMVARRDGALDRDAPLPTPADGPELALMFRQADDVSIGFHIAVDDLLFAVKVTHEGLDAQAVALANGLEPGAAQAAMDRAAAIGLVIRPV